MAAQSSRKSIQILAAAAVNLCQMTYGISYSLSSFAIPQLLMGENGMRLSEVETSWFASIMALGTITGAFHGGFFAEKIGRKKSLLLDCVGLVLSYCLMSFVEYFPIVLVGRFLSGHFSGSSMVGTSMFVSETSHPDIRGFTGTLFVIEYGTGFTLSMLLGAIFPWKTVVRIAMSIPTLAFVIILFLKESPSWLIRHNKEEEAIKCLTFYRGDPIVVSEEIKRIKVSASLAAQNEVEDIKEIDKITRKLRRLTDMSFLRPFILLNLMRIGIEWGGFPALAFYMHTILANLKIPFNPYWMAVIIAAFRSVICIILSFILIKTPRRTMYLFSGGLVAIALFCQAGYAWINPFIPEYYMEYTKWIPLISIFIHYLGYGLGWGAITYMLQGEILPSDMRSFGGGLIGIMGNVYLFLAVKTLPSLLESVGVGGTFSIYCGVSLLVLTSCFFAMPETKGMSLEDIEDYYSNASKQQSTKKFKDPEA